MKTQHNQREIKKKKFVLKGNSTTVIKHGPGSSSRGIRNNKSEFFCRNWGPHPGGWAQDSWNTTLLPHHPPIRRKLHAYQSSLQISPVKTLSWKPCGSLNFLSTDCLLFWSCSKPFPAPNSDILVCLASSCVRHINLHSRNTNVSLAKANHVGKPKKYNLSTIEWGRKLIFSV